MAAPDSPVMAATVGEWNAIVRRARIGQKRKLSCLLVSSYADPDGTSIYCGVARLASDMECSYRTAQRYLEWMRSAGLIELVAVANRRRGLNDEYRLALTPKLFDEIDLGDPEEYKAVVGTLAERNRVRQKSARAKAGGTDQTSSLVTSEAEPEGTSAEGQSDVILDDVCSGDQTSSLVTSEVRDQTSSLVTSTPTMRTTTSPVSLTSHDPVGVRTELAVPRARGREDQISTNGEHRSDTPAPGSGTAPPAAALQALLTPPPEPARRPCPTGLGICVPCWEQNGAFVVAADETGGSFCARHAREQAQV